jgi:hypothetical protein
MITTVFIASSVSVPLKKCFQKKKRKKRKQELRDRLTEVECYKSRRVARRSRTIMRMQPPAGPILAAF